MSLRTLWNQSDSSIKIQRRATRQTKSEDDGPEVENEVCSQNASLTEDAVTSIVERVSEILDMKLRKHHEPIADMSAKIDTLLSRVGNAEQRISDLEDQSTSMVTRVLDLEKTLEKSD